MSIAPRGMGEWTRAGFIAAPGLRMAAAAAAKAEMEQHMALISSSARTATLRFKLTALDAGDLRRVFLPGWLRPVKVKPSDHRAKRHTLRRRRK
jgi:hypothetical protein